MVNESHKSWPVLSKVVFTRQMHRPLSSPVLSPSWCWGSAISVPYPPPTLAPAMPWIAVQSPLTPELIYSRAFGDKTSSHCAFPCAIWIFCSCTRRAVFWIWTWIGPLLCHFLTLGQTLSSLSLNFFITRIGRFMLLRTCNWPSVWGFAYKWTLMHQIRNVQSPQRSSVASVSAKFY